MDALHRGCFTSVILNEMKCSEESHVFEDQEDFSFVRMTKAKSFDFCENLCQIENLTGW
jgi:hypothetical protein